MTVLVHRATRLLFVLTLVPAVVLGSVGAKAILIHEHHGHDPHEHSLALGEVDDWLANPEHGHEEHDHDGLPDEPPADDSGTVVIVLELPDGLLRVRGQSNGTVCGTRLAPSLARVAVPHDPALSSPFPCACPWSAAPDLRAGSTVAGILLANHALLL